MRHPTSGRLLLVSGILLCSATADAFSTRSVRFYGTGTGQRDRIKLPVDPPTPADVGVADFTVEFWMRGTLAGNRAPSAGYRADGQSEANDVDWIYGNIVVDRDIYGPGPDFGISLHRDGPLDDRGVIRFGTQDPARQHTLQGRVHVLDGAWHHVAVVRVRGSGRKFIYVDGALDVQSSAGVSTGDLRFPDGYSGAAQDRFLVFAAEKHDAGSAYPSFGGWLDEIRVWNVARSSGQIAAARTQALPGNTAGLALYLRLEEGAGQALTDATGGNSATLYRGVPGEGEWSTMNPAGSPAPTTTTTTTLATTTTSPPTTTTTRPSTTTTTRPSTTSTTTPTSSTTSTTTTTPPLAGLAAAFSFGEASGPTVADASGNGNTGTLSGATRTPQGRFGAALVFGGDGDFVSVPDRPVLDLSAALTLEAWVYPTGLGGYRVIADKTTTGAPSNYYLALAGDEVSFGFLSGGAWREHVTSTANLILNRWTHVAATFSDALNNVRLYVDGTERLSAVESSSPQTNGDQLRIGIGFADEAFAGRIDEVRLYNRALSVTEIRSDMNRPVSGSASANGADRDSTCPVDAPTFVARTLIVRGARAAHGIRLRASFGVDDAFDPSASGVALEARGDDGTLVYRATVPGTAFRVARRDGSVHLRGASANVGKLVLMQRNGTLHLHARGLSNLPGDLPPVTWSLRPGC